MTPEIDELALIVSLDEQKRWQDPMSVWAASSEPQDYAIRAWVKGLFTYAHSGNRSGKSEGFCAPMVAMAMGKDSIRGYRGKPIPLPVLDPITGPAMFILSGESYKALSLGAVQTVRNLLGGWDYKEEHAGGPDSVTMFRIRHKLAKDDSQWSRIAVFPYDGALPEGPGVDGWIADEPPPERFLTALVSRIRAGRTMRAGIPATPREKNKWWHISQRFPKTKMVYKDKWNHSEPENGRVRIQWSAELNEALSEQDKAQLLALAKGDKYERSILWGDEINVAGGCPWPAELLEAALKQCVPPKRVERMMIEGDASGNRMIADFQVWEDPIPGESYYIVGDPAKGIRDGKHDPDGLHVRRRTNKALVGRLSGYLGGWGLGNAMADLHTRYNRAVCDPLTTGGYGEALLQALRKRKVGNLTRDRVEVRPGDWQERIGTIETHEMRGKMVGAVEREILSGEFCCPSAEVVTCLMDCTVDENGKVLASPGGHDEDLICWGRAAVYMGQWDAPKITSAPARTKYLNPVQEILKKIAKRDEETAFKYAPKAIRNGRPMPRGPATISIEP